MLTRFFILILVIMTTSFAHPMVGAPSSMEPVNKPDLQQKFDSFKPIIEKKLGG